MYQRLEANKWSFKQAGKTRRPDGTRVYGVYPLPNDAGPSSFADLTNAQGELECKTLENWLPVSAMPSNIHAELLHHGIIKDPSLGLNEDDVQWVGEVDWLYRCSFSTPSAAPDQHVDLLFDGLDTLATIYINGKRCYTSDNAFTSHRIPITDFLKTEEEANENEFVIHFSSSFMHGRDLDMVNVPHGMGIRAVFIFESPSINMGPTILTCGISGSPVLHSYRDRLSDVHIFASISGDLECELSFTSKVLRHPHPLDHRAANQDLFLTATISGAGLDQPLEFAKNCYPSSTTTEQSFTGHLPKVAGKKLKLWWPVGYGFQHLYTVRVELWQNKELIDSNEKRIGFRNIEVAQRPLKEQAGTSFFFRVNNVPVFLAGSNWIPADSFPARMTADRYREWLTLLCAGGQNSVRVWGGGLYEQEAFYDTCDEMGILVWQDFMFACAAYPADLADFRQSVKVEAEQVAKRLGQHACLAIFAGNNEDYQVAEAEQLGWDPSDDNPENWLKTRFPARYLYEKLLPEVVKEATSVFYHPGSPWKTGSNTRDTTKGDIHQWNVWHGTQEPYQNWDKLGGRFVSEFGMHALPDLRTIDQYLEYKNIERYPLSKTVQMHNKAGGGQSRLEHYLITNFRHDMDMQSYIYASQLMQAECLASAYAVWRRMWKGEGREYCGGALVWQLNDVYPCISWSIVDYYMKLKPAYYTIKRAIQPIAINLKRIESIENPDPRSGKTVKHTSVQIWGASSLQIDRAMLLILEVFHLQTGQALQATARSISLGSNQSTELGSIELKDLPADKAVVAARLFDPESSLVVSRAHNWPEPYKFLHFIDPGLTMSFDGKRIKLKVDRPLKGLIFSMPSSPRYPVPDIRYSDNCFDLMPGDEREIEMQGFVEGGPRPYSRWYR
ncbi:MAG: hypothetical protein CYPHOPRED_001232 [Cyphobasidiales sp. Tagirdzhanova-0007]|nr:MAG: hypothetical protein CYPHOPRED_001232 [Cyphobasidiales sp. Tagirdzhanova-0007]